MAEVINIKERLSFYKELGQYKLNEDSKKLVCDCGNDRFLIRENGIYCPDCNAWALIIKLF